MEELNQMLAEAKKCELRSGLVLACSVRDQDEFPLWKGL